MTEVIVPCKESWSSDVTITATKSVALPITADTAKKKKKTFEISLSLQWN